MFNSPYQFALIDKQRAYVGVGLQTIVQSWSALEQWFHSAAARHQTAVGYIGYDGTIYFGIFKKLQPMSVRQLTDPTPFQLGPVRGEAFRVYRKKITQLKHHLAVGDIYQANYCYRLTAKTIARPQQLLHHFTHAQPTPYGALIHTPDLRIISNSPELGLRIDGQLLETRPMKGTRPRDTHGRNPMYQALLHSAKDTAELDMIIDVARNDLAQVAVPGSIRVKHRRQIVGYATVWQAQAVIQAQRLRQADSLTVLKAMLPFASITGAPKLRAIELLHHLEAQPRGVYCGAIGYIAGRTKAQFNVAIRTATLQHGLLYYSVGSGVTLASKAQQEYQETLDKAAILQL